MAAILPVLAIALVALEAHLRGREAIDRRLLRAGLVLGLGHLAQLLALRALATDLPASAQFPLLGLFSLVSLATVWGALRLLAFGARRRDLWVRGVLGALVLLATLAGPTAGLFFAFLGLLAFRWRVRLSSRHALGLALVTLVLLLLEWVLRPGRVLVAPGAPEAWLQAGTWCSAVASIYLTLAFPMLMIRFVRDPSLGIRTVGWRLAFSHVVVVAVPLALLGALWASTTLLGVQNDRATTAGRALAAEGRTLSRELATLLATGGGPDAWRAHVSARGERWREARLYLRERGTLLRVAGDSLPGESRLASWPDSVPRLPAAGFVRLGEDFRFGAVGRDPADSTRALVLLVPYDPLVQDEPASISGARLQVATIAPDPERSGVLGERSPERRERITRQDSLALQRALRMTRALGMPDSSVRSPRRANLRFVTPEDTLDANAATGLTRRLFLSGNVMIPGVTWEQGHWRRERVLITARVAPFEALAGLYRGTRDNPISLLPVLLLLAVSAVAVVVILFDFFMVTGITRGLGATIGALKEGAERLEAGDLAHRIPLRGDDDLWDVGAAFNQAVAGLERARDLEKMQARMESELALARQIQSRLLPAGPPRVAGFEIAGLYDPARQVGGDYYDHLPVGEGRVLLVIADVSGKGVPASLLMSGFRASLMSQDLRAWDPVALAEHLNDFLVRSVELGKFVTAFLAFADARAGTLDYVNAGHNPPVLRRSDGTHRLLEEGGTMFGVLPGAPYVAGRAPFEPGDLLVLFTDGVTEGTDKHGELWGDDRLVAALDADHALACAQLARSIGERVRAFEGDQGRTDDVTLLVARRLPLEDDASPPPA